MKKLLSILAIATIVFCMASCNQKNEANSQRFKISVTDVTETSAHLTIVPADKEMTYVYYLYTIGTYNYFEATAEGIESLLKQVAVGTGTVDIDLTKLLPGVKHIVCVAEKDADKKELVGKIETARFETKGMESQLAEFMEEGEELPITGEVKFVGENLILISCNCPFPDEEGLTLQMYLFFISDKFDGHFGSDDMFAFFIYQPNVQVLDGNGNVQGDVMMVCKSDITGTYDAETGKYTYRGTCDFFAGDDGMYYLPFKAECTAAEEAEEQEED